MTRPIGTATLNRVRQDFIAFVGGGYNMRGQFPKTLSELDDDVRDFVQRFKTWRTDGRVTEHEVCRCGHSAGSHNSIRSLRFNCLATTDGTHATRCDCRQYAAAPVLPANCGACGHLHATAEELRAALTVTARALTDASDRIQSFTESLRAGVEPRGLIPTADDLEILGVAERSARRDEATREADALLSLLTRARAALTPPERTP